MRLHLQSVVAAAIASAAVILLFAAINVPDASAIDPTSALRGSLGVSLDDLSLSGNFGRVSLLLNGGFALLFAAFACFAAVRRHGPNRDHGHFSDWRSGNSVTSS